MGLFAFSPIKKLLLTKKHIDQRYLISISWINMGTEKTKTIIFSDEPKFNFIYPDSKPYVWREPRTGLKPEYLDHTVKYGGKSVMVWGYFSYHRVERLVFIGGTMDSPHYVSILADHLFTSPSEMGLDQGWGTCGFLESPLRPSVALLLSDDK
jgi:hypothetical protein